MRMIPRVVGLTLLVSVVWGGRLQAGEREVVLDSLLWYDGTVRMLTEIGEGVDALLGHFEGKVDSAEYEAWREVVQESFGPATGSATLRASIEGRFDMSPARAVIAYRQSRVGRKVAAADTAELSDQEYEQISRFASLPLSELDTTIAARHRLLQESKSLMAALSQATTILPKTTEAVYRTVNPLLPPPHRLSAAQLEKQLREQRELMEEFGIHFAFAQVLYTYRELTDEEFRAMVAFEDSPAGQWYNAILTEAVGRIIDEGCERFRDRVGGR